MVSLKRVESLQFHFDELSRSGQTLDLGATPSAALGALLVGYLLAIVVGLVFRIGSLPADARDSVKVNLVPKSGNGPIGLSPAPLYRFGYAALRQGALLGLVGIALTSAVLGASLQVVSNQCVRLSHHRKLWRARRPLGRHPSIWTI